MGLALLYFQIHSFSPLTYDDPHFLAQHPAANLSLSSGSFWKTLLTTSSINLWHPLTDLTHQLLYRLSKGPALHLAVNVLLHGLNASLLMLLLRKMTGRVSLSLALSLLFAWHPATVESVAWISGRKDLLCTFFLLLAIGLHLWREGERTPSYWAGMILFSIASCMCKPIGFVLPFLLLAIDYWPLQRNGSVRSLLLEKWPLWIIAMLSVVTTLLFQAGGSQATSDPRSLPVRAVEAFWALSQSLRILFVPKGLHLAYSNPEQIPLIWLLVAVVAGGAMLALLFWNRSRFPFVVTGLFWYLVTLGPTLGFVRAGNNLAADRYCYLPLVGLLVGLAGLLVLVTEKKGKQASLVALFAVAMLLFSISLRQVSDWRSQEALFTRVVEIDPGNSIATIELATLAFHREDDSDVRTRLASVLAKVPQSPGAHLLLGHLAYREGDYEEAYQHYQIAAVTRSQEAFLQERLAACAHGVGDLEKARLHLTAAFALERPQDQNLELSKKWKLVFPNLSEPGAK